jgi:hypothetical protein
VTAAEQGLLGAPDEQHVARAAALGRVIVTADHDFLTIANELFSRGTPFPGLLFIQPQTSVGEAVRAIEDVASFREPAEMANWIDWVP